MKNYLIILIILMSNLLMGQSIVPPGPQTPTSILSNKRMIIMTTDDVVDNCNQLRYYTNHKIKKEHIDIKIIKKSDIPDWENATTNEEAYLAMKSELSYQYNNWTSPNSFFTWTSNNPKDFEYYLFFIGSLSEVPYPWIANNQYCDLAFSDVNSNWDVGKNYYHIPNGVYGGRYTSLSTGAIDSNDFYDDGIKMKADYYVGRLPLYDSDYSTIDRYLKRVIDYENGVNNGDWSNVLQMTLPVSFWKYGRDFNDSILPNLENPPKLRRLFENSTISLKDPEVYSNYISRDMTMDAWSKRAGFMISWSHGVFYKSNQVMYSPLYGDDIYFKNDPKTLIEYDENYNEIVYPTIWISHSCSGLSVNSNSLAYNYIKTNGLVLIGHPKTSSLFGYENIKNNYHTLIVGYSTMKRFYENNESIGMSFWESKDDYFDENNFNGPPWWNTVDMYGYNLYGDPSVKLFRKDNEPEINRPIVKWVSDMQINAGNSTQINLESTGKYYPYNGSDIISIWCPTADSVDFLTVETINDSTLNLIISPDISTEGTFKIFTFTKNEIGLISGRSFILYVRNAVNEKSTKISPFITDLQVYPNPSDNDVNIKFSQSESFYELSIIDIEGKVVYSEREDNFEGVYNIKIPMESGIYFINLSNKDGNINKKVVVY